MTMEEKNKLVVNYINDNVQIVINKYGNIITQEQVIKAVNMLTNSQEDFYTIKHQIDLAIEQIIKNYLNKSQNVEKHYELNDMFDCRITNDTLHIHVVPESLKEDIDEMGYKNFLDFMDVKIQDALAHIPEILEYPENKNINTIFAVSPLLHQKSSQKIFEKYGFQVSNVVDTKFLQMFNGKKVGQAVISKKAFLEKYKNQNKDVDLQTHLNSQTSEFLKMIEEQYGQYMTPEQKNLLTQLKSSEIVIVESSSDKWLENQIQDIKNNPNLSEEQKQKEIDETKQHKITAHGSKVFHDGKIHFYPFNITTNENQTLENVCIGMLIHELLHYFISPEYMNIPGFENSESINSYITEGLVDMCARDLMSDNQSLETYNSKYASNVILVREKLSKIESLEQKMNLIFQGNMEQIISKIFGSSDKAVQEYSASKKRQTIFDEMIKQLAVSCNEENAQGIENYIYNLSANAKNKKEAINAIRYDGERLYPEKKDSINNIIYTYEYMEKQNEINEKRKQLIQQKLNLEQQNSEDLSQEKGPTRKLIPNNQIQNNENKNGFTNILLLSLVTSGFILLVAILTSLFIK